jgi:hypothetical protein
MLIEKVLCYKCPICKETQLIPRDDMGKTARCEKCGYEDTVTRENASRDFKLPGPIMILVMLGGLFLIIFLATLARQLTRSLFE